MSHSKIAYLENYISRLSIGECLPPDMEWGDKAALSLVTGRPGLLPKEDHGKAEDILAKLDEAQLAFVFKHRPDLEPPRQDADDPEVPVAGSVGPGIDAQDNEVEDPEDLAGEGLPEPLTVGPGQEAQEEKDAPEDASFPYEDLPAHIRQKLQGLVHYDDGSCIEWSRNGRTSFVDYGETFLVPNARDKQGVEAVIALAAHRWGGKITLDGPPDFVQAAMKEAARQGVKVTNPELTEDFRKICKKQEEKRQLAAVREANLESFEVSGPAN